jgi:hypothetical protein
MKPLSDMIELYERAGHPALLENFVLKYGREFAYMGALAREDRLKPRMCFMNATHLALEHKLTYVEGYAWRDDFKLIIHHAWCADEDRVIDPTWAEHANYYGVSFTPDQILKRVMHTGTYGAFYRGHRLDVTYLDVLQSERD